jgi:hypothetical protein
LSYCSTTRDFRISAATAGRRRAALHGFSLDGDVLDHALGFADRTQSSFGGCRLNFDSGCPGYQEAGTLAWMLRPHGYRTYMLGKWHVAPLTESGTTGRSTAGPLAAVSIVSTASWMRRQINTLPIWCGTIRASKLLGRSSTVHGARTHYVFHAGKGHLPTEVARDVRGRSYLIEALAGVDHGSEGVLIAHGDATTG